MQFLVTWWSQTGNTLKIAKAIFESLPENKTFAPLSEAPSLDGVDLTFIGFPVMQFGPPPLAKKFIKNHTSGKKIALFVTHAINPFSDDPKQQALLRKEIGQCREAAIGAGAELSGIYHCQGELSQQVADSLSDSGIPMLMEFATMRPLTLGHPDDMDVENARSFAKKIISSL